MLQAEASNTDREAGGDFHLLPTSVMEVCCQLTSRHLYYLRKDPIVTQYEAVWVPEPVLEVWITEKLREYQEKDLSKILWTFRLVA